MKAEYDFSKGNRGKFYRKDAVLRRRHLQYWTKSLNLVP